MVEKGAARIEARWQMVVRWDWKSMRGGRGMREIGGASIIVNRSEIWGFKVTRVEVLALRLSEWRFLAL